MNYFWPIKIISIPLQKIKVMKVGLLKKLKKKYTIVKMYDDVLGQEVFRLLYKNKMVDYGWVQADDKDNYRLLILFAAYGGNYEWFLEGTEVNERAKHLESSIKYFSEKRLSRKIKQKRNNKLKSAEVIWP